MSDTFAHRMRRCDTVSCDVGSEIKKYKHVEKVRMAVTELLYTDRTGACHGIFAGKFGTSVFIFPVLGRLGGKPHSSDTGLLMRRAEAWIGRKK